MYTEYNSNNVDNNNNYNDYSSYNDYNNVPKPNKFLSILWKILLVIIILIIGFMLLIKFNVISFSSSVMPNAILLNQNEVGIKKGKSYQLVSTVLPENANNKQVIWTSSDPKIVSVNETTGYITGLKEGSATITVKTLINDVSTDCVVNVTDKNVLVTSITIHQKQINIAVGYTQSLSYTVLPKNATENSLIFTSSDSSVATVDGKGLVKGLKEGSAVITVSSSNSKVKDTAYVTVYKNGGTTVVDGEPVKTSTYPKSITLNPTELNLNLASTSQIVATISPKDANSSISWSSSNSRVAIVDSNGLVKAVGVGEALIVAKTVNNLTANVKVTVGNYNTRVKRIMITTNYLALTLGHTEQFVVEFTPKDASNKTIYWSSSNSNVVTVDASGTIKAVGAGTATIKATSADGGYTDTATIEVSNYGNVISAKSITFDKSSYIVGVNKTINITPIITPSNATYKAVTFESSDPSIATVDKNGVITGLKAGTVNIEARLNKSNLKAVVKVEVKYIPATSIKLNSSNINLKKGETYTIVASIVPSDASSTTLEYTSNNPSIATVDSNGIITGLNTGQAIITIKTKDNVVATTIVNVN